MITRRLSDLYVLFISQVERFTGRKNWISELTLAGTLLALFFGFPSYELIYGEFLTFWKPLFVQAQHPFTNIDYNPITHEAKLTFRLLIPLLIRYLHLNILSLVLLTHLAGIFSIYLFIRLVFKITEEKTTTVLLTLAFVSLGVAKFSFVTNCGLFDGIAFMFLLLAILSSRALVILAAVFLASWIDERALIASSLVFVWHWFYSKKQHAFAVSAAWAGYLGIRYYLSVFVGLKTHTGGTGIQVLTDNMNSAPLGLFSGIEGFWMLVFFSLWILVLQKKWWQFTLFTGSLLVVTLVSLLVVDITRSIYYIFPAIPIALKIVSGQEARKDMVLLSFGVLLLSALFPAYVVSGLGAVQWQYPLPLQLVRYLTYFF